MPPLKEGQQGEVCFLKKILDISHPEIYKETNFRDSEFVEIETNEYLTVEMQYPLLGMKNAESQCLVRKEVYELLIKAARLLPSGYRLKILDAWRPFALQRELYLMYSEKIIKEFKLYECTKEQKNVAIARFVSKPVENQNMPPVHTTGGAVDLTIIGKDGCDLYMGTEFDAFTDKANTSYFEKVNDSIARKNRRLLYYVMTDVGFTNLPSEWWHYDYGDSFWAFYNKKPAIYKGVFSKEKIYEQTGQK